MYRLFISQRYLQSRLFSYVSVVGLALGVALLVVVNSVMGGFSVTFQDRIRGTLAHVIVEGAGDAHLTNEARAREALLLDQVRLLRVPFAPPTAPFAPSAPLFTDPDYRSFLARVGAPARSEYSDEGVRIAQTPYLAGEVLEVDADTVWLARPEEDTVAIPRAFVDTIVPTPVAHLSPYLQRLGIVVSPQNQEGAQLRAVHPELEAQTSRFGAFLQSPGESFEEAYGREFGDPLFGSLYGSRALLYSLFRLQRIDGPTYRELSAESAGEESGLTRRYAAFLGYVPAADALPADVDAWVPEHLTRTELEDCRRYQRALGAAGLVCARRDIAPLDSLLALTRRALPTARLESLFEHTASGLPGVVLGVDLLRYLRAGPGDTLTLTTFKKVADKREPVDRKFEVVGSYASGFSDIDRYFCYADLEEIQELIEERVLTGINIAVRDFHESREAARTLEDQLAVYYPVERLRARSWEESNRTLLQAVQQQRFLISMIIFFMMVLAGVVLLVILLMLVNEKIKDLGILKAVGATTSGVLSTFLFQGFIIGLAGSGLGIVAGVAFAEYINPIAGWLEVLLGIDIFPKEVYFLDQIPVLINPFEIGLIVLPTVIISLGLSVYPAYRAAKLHPLDALRHE